MEGPKLFLSVNQAGNDQDKHISFNWEAIWIKKSINGGFENINLHENFQKRIKCAARLLDRLEYSAFPLVP